MPAQLGKSGLVICGIKKITGFLFSVIESVKYTCDDCVEGLMRWTDNLLIGIEEIDKQHKSLFDCLARLEQSADTNIRSSALETALLELLDYTKNHFSMEEALMREHHYPLLDTHVIEHQILSQAIDRLSDKSVSRDTFDDTVRLLNDWLANHIGSSDRHYALHFQKTQKI